MNQEFILCSAIWYKDIPIAKPECLNQRGQNPYNVDKGVVFCGWRHFNCIMVKAGLTGLRDAESGEFVQGFLTSKNRFVDREEGAIIAFEAGQLAKGVKLKKLHSEDLY